MLPLNALDWLTASAILDIKQSLSMLSAADRRIVSAYLLRLKQESAAGRRDATRTMREMDAGKEVRLRDVAKRLGHA